MMESAQNNSPTAANNKLSASVCRQACLGEGAFKILGLCVIVVALVDISKKAVGLQSALYFLENNAVPFISSAIFANYVYDMVEIICGVWLFFKGGVYVKNRLIKIGEYKKIYFNELFFRVGCALLITYIIVSAIVGIIGDGLFLFFNRDRFIDELNGSEIFINDSSMGFMFFFRHVVQLLIGLFFLRIVFQTR